MLGKLTKYEFKATARVLLPAYLALLLVTVLGKVLLAVPPVQEALNGAIAGFFVVIYMLMIMGVLFLTFFISVQRFYKNLLGDEGYLMHTLPVKVSTHILSLIHILQRYLTGCRRKWQNGHGSFTMKMER